MADTVSERQDDNRRPSSCPGTTSCAADSGVDDCSDFFSRQARLHAEAKLALAQVCSIAPFSSVSPVFSLSRSLLFRCITGVGTGSCPPMAA